MKKIIALILLMAGVSHADTSRVSLSSFTATNETACIQARYLNGVVVGATSGVSSTLKLYNSTFTTSGVPIISSISLNTVMPYDYFETGVKGICYITNLNAAGVTIIYEK